MQDIPPNVSRIRVARGNVSSRVFMPPAISRKAEMMPVVFLSVMNRAGMTLSKLKNIM